MKRLSERYFLELKNRLRDDNEAFWAKLVSELGARDEQERLPVEKA